MKKITKVPEGRPSDKWTIGQIKEYIRRETAVVNTRINEFKNKNFSEKQQTLVNKMIGKLKTNSGVKSGGNRGEIGLGLSTKRYRKKNELLQQAKGLQEFEQFDIFSDTAEKEYSDKIKKAYNTFQKMYHMDMSMDQYEDMVEMLGTIGSEVLGKFNYMGVIEAYNEAIQDGRSNVNLVAMVNDVMKEAKGQGYNAREITEEIVRRIQEI